MRCGSDQSNQEPMKWAQEETFTTLPPPEHSVTIVTPGGGHLSPDWGSAAVLASTGSSRWVSRKWPR